MRMLGVWGSWGFKGRCETWYLELVYDWFKVRFKEVSGGVGRC